MRGNNATSWTDIADEIEKGLMVPLGNKELNGKLQAVLVIAFTNMAAEIEVMLGNEPCIVCDAGTWSYHRVECKYEFRCSVLT